MSELIFHEDTLFEGIVTHSRFKPFIHHFKYDATYFWFDINKFCDQFFFKKNRFSLFSFYENDHGQKNKKKVLYKSIIKNLKLSKDIKINSIKVLCLPRILGYAFNPISIFICYDKLEKPKIIIFEVNNTFNERHSYYCKVVEKKKDYNFRKKLYVSPFFKVEGFYKISFKLIKKKIFLSIDYNVKNKKVFNACFKGNAVKLDSKNLLIIFFKKIFQNIKITSGIYFQALKLYIKGAKYIKKPTKPNKDFTPTNL